MGGDGDGVGEWGLNRALRGQEFLVVNEGEHLKSFRDVKTSGLHLRKLAPAESTGEGWLGVRVWE